MGREGLTEEAQADMRDWFSVDSPHSSGDSSDPAEDKPSEHVGVMEERRLSSLGHHFVSVFSGYKHTKLCQLKIAIKNHK